MTRVAVGLGSNVGDRARHIADAVGELESHGEVIAVSSLYETAPIGGPDQEPFLNAVVLIDTGLDPGELLAACLAIEAVHGRQRRERWGPRTLDLDILLFGDAEIRDPGLIVPHPRLEARRFVLEPLLEVDPMAALPDGTPLQTLLASVADQEVARVARPTPGRGTAVATFLLTGTAAAFLWWLVGKLL